MRPRQLVAVAGTGTEVGKTWVARRVLEALRAAGVRVAARKPAQSYEVDAAGAPTEPTDADELAAGSGEDPADVCPAHRRYPVAMAPPMAADVLGLPRIPLADLVAELGGSWPPDAVDVGLVELAGGVRSPIAHDGDGVDLLRALRPDVVLVVADAGLGTINAVRTTLDALDSGATPVGDDGRPPVVVHLNRFDPAVDLHVRNARWLRDAGVDPTTTLEDLCGRLVPGFRDAAT